MGGAGTYAADLAVGLSTIGHEVMVLAPDYPQFREEVQQIDRTRPHGIRRMNLSPGPIRYLQGAWWLSKEVCRFRPDVLLVADGMAQRAAAVLVTCRPSLQYEVMVHGTEIIVHFKKNGLVGCLNRGLMNLFFRKAQHIICNSSHTRRVLLETLPWLADRVTVTPLGIDLSRLPPVKDEEIDRLKRDLDLQGPVLLTVARVIAEKGHDAVIRSLPLVIREIPSLRYIVVGDGPNLESLQSLAFNELGLHRNVTFIGRCPPRAVGLFYAVANAFILLSRYGPSAPVAESFGLVFLEAWAYGKPVIGSKNGAIPEVIDHEINGLLVDDAVPEEVAGAIRFLLENPEKARQMGTNGRHKVETEFNAVAMAERTLAALVGGFQYK